MERKNVQSTNASDRDRFEALWGAHHRRVYTYCLRRLNDPDAANDATAETFLVAWRRLGEMPAHELPWLLAVSRGIISNLDRGHRRRDALFARLIAEPDPETDSTELDSGSVVPAFNSLSRADREVLSLVVWEELCPSEAANVLGISTPRFSVRLHRAKRRLRTALENPEAGRCSERPDESQSATSQTARLEAK